MDPDETLRLIRATMHQMRVDEVPEIRKQHADDLAEHIEALDEWLTKGGFLPSAWVAKDPAAETRTRVRADLGYSPASTDEEN